jgi:hypothetical protein
MFLTKLVKSSALTADAQRRHQVIQVVSGCRPKIPFELFRAFSQSHEYTSPSRASLRISDSPTGCRSSVSPRRRGFPKRSATAHFCQIRGVAEHETI